MFLRRHKDQFSSRIVVIKLHRYSLMLLESLAPFAMNYATALSHVHSQIPSKFDQPIVLNHTLLLTLHVNQHVRKTHRVSLRQYFDVLQLPSNLPMVDESTFLIFAHPSLLPFRLVTNITCLLLYPFELIGQALNSASSWHQSITSYFFE